MISGRDDGRCELGKKKPDCRFEGSHLKFSGNNVFHNVVRNQVEVGLFDGDSDGLNTCMVVNMNICISTLAERPRLFKQPSNFKCSLVSTIMSLEAEWPVFWSLRGLTDHGSRWRLITRVRLLVTPSAPGTLVYFTVDLTNCIQIMMYLKVWVTYEEVSEHTGWRPKQTICVKGSLSTIKRLGRDLGTYQTTF